MTTHSLNGHGRAPAGADQKFFSENGFERVPQFIQWIATLRCGMSCPHCLSADEQGLADMSLRRVEGLLDQITEMGIPQVLVTGGEPACREDLPEVIDMLRERRQAWEINTAVLPGARLRAAMECYPPSFAAVSLDGPERVHDRFRGRPGAWRSAREAIRFYRGIIDGEVVAGTTVTARNYRHLPQTFAEVVDSGATSWGLHLVIREGRARRNRGLGLSRRQLRGLLDFCAAKRNYFPVHMADEIGYLAEEGPLVRDVPFFCGAGRTQCVVLPDGEVVPCTTLDRSTSAGNVFREGLAEVWRDGFSALRHWQPEGKCRACEYARACGGGCWLQRRSGQQCFKAVWRAPRLAGAAAGMAICFGIALPAASAGDPPRGAAEPQDAGQLVRAARSLVDSWIIRWYGIDMSGNHPEAKENLRQQLVRNPGGDPAAVYCLDFTDWRHARDLASRCKAIRAGLKTGQVSLSLLGMMWRDLTEACLDGKSAAERPAEEKKLLRETLSALEAKAAQWLPVIYRDKLGTFLFRDANRHAFMCKGRLPQCSAWHLLVRDRWPKETKEPVEAYLKTCTFGHAMALPATLKRGPGIVMLRSGKEEKPDGAFEIRIFDVIKTPADAGGEASRLLVGKEKAGVAVDLPPGCELTYADILHLAHEQHPDKLGVPTAGDRDPRLLLPALRAATGDVWIEPSAEDAAKLKRLVEDLGSPEWKKREAASAAIRKLGRPALVALREAARSKDPEVASRAETLGSELLKLPASPKHPELRHKLIDLWLF